MTAEEEKPINIKVVTIICLTIIAVFTILLYISIIVISGEAPDSAILESIIKAIAGS